MKINAKGIRHTHRQSAMSICELAKPCGNHESSTQMKRAGLVSNCLAFVNSQILTNQRAPEVSTVILEIILD